ncbi:hypothetical protein BAE44_0018874 [Dichanthelium oligosanthes]|uniref:Uncharacterized protein n=1 Tax=Dichanthelium oligosanthes TaxID=888268 RepID=A0A1E5V4W2_9POAL|nr:hypothetical protein BAE44_0018874 [Dichanthelium oligosanthes]
MLSASAAPALYFKHAGRLDSAGLLSLVPSRKIPSLLTLTLSPSPSSMQASMDPPPAKAEAAAASVTAPTTPPRPGKAEKAATKAGRPTTLLDVQEVEWITRELERLLAREQMSGGGGGDDAGADGRHRRKRAKLNPAPKKGGFLAELLGRHAVSICSGDGAGAVGSSAPGVDRRGRRRGSLGSFREVEKV